LVQSALRPLLVEPPLLFGVVSPEFVVVLELDVEPASARRIVLFVVLVLLLPCLSEDFMLEQPASAMPIAAARAIQLRCLMSPPLIE
jgi:hypothetical protein